MAATLRKAALFIAFLAGAFELTRNTPFFYNLRGYSAHSRVKVSNVLSHKLRNSSFSSRPVSVWTKHGYVSLFRPFAVDLTVAMTSKSILAPIPLLYTVRASTVKIKQQFHSFLELLNMLLATYVMLIMLILPATSRPVATFIPEMRCTGYVQIEHLHHSFALPKTTCTEERLIGVVELASGSRKSGIIRSQIFLLLFRVVRHATSTSVTRQCEINRKIYPDCSFQ